MPDGSDGFAALFTRQPRRNRPRDGFDLEFRLGAPVTGYGFSKVEIRAERRDVTPAFLGWMHELTATRMLRGATVTLTIADGAEG